MASYFLIQSNYFRSFHCLILSCLSIYNTYNHGYSILDTNNNYIFENDWWFKLITNYALIYLIIDMNNALQRKDLLIHHVLVWFWIYVNYSSGITSWCILNEIITATGFLTNVKIQYTLRIFIVILIRYPVWTMTLMSNYFGFSTLKEIFNLVILIFMMLLDLFWLYKYFMILRKQVKTN